MLPHQAGCGGQAAGSDERGSELTEANLRTVTKKELVNRIADKTGVTKVVAKDVIQSFLDAIIEELAEGNRLEFREFGVFESRDRAARRAQNPRTLEKVDVPAKRIVKFKVGRMMRKKVSGDDVGEIEVYDDDDDEDDHLDTPPVKKPAGGKEAGGIA
jgi:integration host factor subunit beta